MKVFISWSGKRSNALALALKDWLPLILQYAKPWVSDKDISAGDRWAQAIAGELESSNFGIICVTPENLNSEWILFEAGALSKSMQDGKVLPLLFGIEFRDLSGPLSQFQALKMDEEGVLEVIKSINSVAEKKAEETAINELVPALWPKLQQKLDDIPDKEILEKHARPQNEILEDLVSQVRILGSKIRNIDRDIIDNDEKYYGKNYRYSDRSALKCLIKSDGDHIHGDVILVLLAGIIRKQLPWLAELLIESHRDLKSANPREAHKIRDRILSVFGGPFGEHLVGRSKLNHVLMMELPHILERAIASSFEARQQTSD